MVSEKVAGGAEREGEEMNGNGPSKVVIGGGGGGVGGAYRWKNGGGDAVQLKRRRVGLSNGRGSASDDGEVNSSSDDEEVEEEEQQLDLDEDDVEEGAVEEYSDDYEQGGRGIGRAVGGPSAAVDEDDDEEEEEEEERVEEEANEEDEDDLEQDLVGATATMDRHRGGNSSNGNRGRQPVVGFVEENDESYYEDEPLVPDSPPLARNRGREREREREIEMSSAEEFGGLPSSDDSEDERVRVPQQPMYRGMVERGQSSSIVRESENHHHHHHREVVAVVAPEKPAKGMVDTAKRKAPEGSGAISRNGSAAQPKPKKKQEKAPAAPKKKPNNGVGTSGPKERQRFSTDNKARVTLERAREILAGVKAAMMKDPKQYSVRHIENHAGALENSSSSEEERRIRMAQPLASSQRVVHLSQQVKSEEKVVKKRSRATLKGGDAKEPAPRKRKPKVEAGLATDEKAFYRSRPQQAEGHDHAYKSGHFTSGAEIGDVDDPNGYGRDDGYEQQQQQITAVEKKVRKRRKTKEGEDSASATGLCPGSVIRDENWAPPPSPFGLIQESLYKDPWKVLLSCMLLNKTAGRQMHKVIWDLFSLCPDAETAINMDTAKIAEKVYSLGLQNKRAKMIQRFSLEYLRGDWTNVTQLHGIGKYAADAYAIFCQGLWRQVEPDDLMLNKYWKWLCDTDGRGTTFDDAEQS